jgi:hypothetical protein
MHEMQPAGMLTLAPVAARFLRRGAQPANQHPRIRKMPRQKALIAGATGVVGRNLLRHLLSTGEWEITTLSRRKPDVQGAYEHITIDLLDTAQCTERLAHLTDVTHIFYVAVATNPDPLAPALLNANMMMLRNVVETTEPIAARLQHIHFMQGTKWYGSHLGEFKTPAREDHPRHMPPNFYYNQWDYMVGAAACDHRFCPWQSQQSDDGDRDLRRDQQGTGAAAMPSGHARELPRAVSMHRLGDAGARDGVDGHHAAMR